VICEMRGVRARDLTSEQGLCRLFGPLVTAVRHGHRRTRETRHSARARLFYSWNSRLLKQTTQRTGVDFVAKKSGDRQTGE
jgi:hypothetical protein